MDHDHIDVYCERVGPDFWAEPINAVTNLAFIIAALVLAVELSRARRQPNHDPANWILVLLVLAIGIGSFLFHTLAVFWAALADVIPIGLFILAATYLAITRLVGLPYWGGLIAVLVVLVLATVPPALIGLPGGPYVAALITMAAIGLFLTFARRHAAGPAVLVAAGLFAVSLTLRTIDEPLCSIYPLGTHFFWHVLNAIVLYLVTRAIIRYGTSARHQGA